MKTSGAQRLMNFRHFKLFGLGNYPLQGQPKARVFYCV